MVGLDGAGEGGKLWPSRSKALLTGALALGGEDMSRDWVWLRKYGFVDCNDDDDDDGCVGGKMLCRPEDHDDAGSIQCGPAASAS